jgi:hypothetical protein
LTDRAGKVSNPVIARLVKIYDNMKTGIAAGRKTATGLVRKGEVELYKTELSALFREAQTDPTVMSVWNSLFDDLERAGAVGIQQGREAFRQAITKSDDFMNSSLIKENKLNRYHRLTAAEKRQLQEIQKHIGVNFIDDLESVTASQELDKLDKITKEGIGVDLDQATNEKWYNTQKDKLRPYLGKDTDKIFKEVKAYQKAQQIRTGIKWTKRIASLYLAYEIMRRITGGRFRGGMAGGAM